MNPTRLSHGRFERGLMAVAQAGAAESAWPGHRRSEPYAVGRVGAPDLALVLLPRKATAAPASEHAAMPLRVGIPFKALKDVVGLNAKLGGTPGRRY